MQRKPIFLLFSTASLKDTSWHYRKYLTDDANHVNIYIYISLSSTHITYTRAGRSGLRASTAPRRRPLGQRGRRRPPQSRRRGHRHSSPPSTSHRGSRQAQQSYAWPSRPWASNGQRASLTSVALDQQRQTGFAHLSFPRHEQSVEFQKDAEPKRFLASSSSLWA